MGNCTCSNAKTRQDGSKNFPAAKVVHSDGRLEEFRRPVTAAEIITLHPNYYLCSSDTMLINSNAPQLPKDHVLQFGQIYFLLPLSKSLSPLSLQDLCALAIKASSGINIDSGTFLDENTRLKEEFQPGSCRDIITF